MKEYKEESMTVPNGLRLSLKRPCWHKINNGQILIAYPTRTLLSSEELTNELKDWEKLSQSEFGSALERLNGFFAIIFLSENRTVIAVDKIRSIPLFYSSNDNEIHVSDDANSLQNFNKNIDPHTIANFDPISAVEFTSGLYLNGSRTLDPSIRQVQAGEWVELCTSQLNNSVNTYDYFRLNYQFDGKDDYSWFSNGLSKATDQAVDNLLTVAGDRQIVLPLSGGFDSRFLGIKLVERGAKNLIAFSYGENENDREVAYARQIAKTLSIDWIFIPDTQEDWEAAWASESRQKYSLNSANLCSFPHFQDWLVVKKLAQTGKIHEHAIFCPGHTGDFVSGGKIPQSIISFAGILTYQKRFSDNADEALDQLAQLIARRDFNRCNIDEHRSEIEARIRENLGSSVDSKQKVDAEFLVQRLYDWVWRQRQAKYIVNSVRVYEDYGYDWWLPFWDSEFLEFWTHVPLSDLLGQSTYVKFINTVYAEIVEMNSDNTITESESSLVDNAARNLWSRNPIMRRFRASIPYHIQESVARMKQRLIKIRYSDSIMPIPSQAVTRIRSQHIKASKAKNQSVKAILSSCPPEDILGLLAQEIVVELLENKSSIPTVNS